MTRAYANVLLSTSKKFIWDGAYFVDVDGDNKAEMILVKLMLLHMFTNIEVVRLLV